MKEIPYPFEDKEMIFGMLFSMSSKLQKLMDRELAPYDITSKQWFLTIVLGFFFKEPPTLSELAEKMEYSHQNVKQIASKLANKGFIRFEKDKKDQRVIRLSLTEKSDMFWKERDKQANQFLSVIFDGLTQNELACTSKALQRISENLNRIESTRIEGE